VLALRSQQQRNMLATLLLSQGVPMLLHGDEMGRTQQGNNNVYCQDNELSWMDWSPEAVDEDLLAFVERLVQLRKDHPVFRRRRFFEGKDVRGVLDRDIAWLRPDGGAMDDDDWSNGFARSLGMLLSGDALQEVDAWGEPVSDDSFLLLLNAHDESVTFVLPNGVDAGWVVELDTATPGPAAAEQLPAGGSRAVPARALVVLRRET
jgi:glycogen operon protein